MKVMILSDANSIHTKRWVAALSSRDIEIILFSLTSSHDDFYAKYNNIKVIGNGKLICKSMISKLSYIGVVPRLRREIKRFKPDLIHAHYASSYGLICSFLKKQIPTIVSAWGSDIYDFPNTALFGEQIIRWNFKKADCILSTSHIMAREVNKYTKKSILITPFGVDINKFKPIPFSKSDHFVVGNVKTLSPKYGIDILIKAFQCVLQRNPTKKLSLEIYGDGPCREEYEQLTSYLGISRNVTFHGFVDNSKLPEIYNSFSISVSVSNNESFGVVAVEAMACACPVVTSDADGFTEVVDNGITGYVVPKQNIEATADAIQKFIDNPSLRDTMGAKGRKRVMDLYNWENNVDTMVEIYKNVINEYSSN